MSGNTSLVEVDKYFQLSELPNAKVLLLLAATTARRKPKATTIAPKVAVRVPKVVFDPAWVREYNQVCGFEGNQIALTAPQILASSLHLYLLSRPMVPFPMLGMVHLRNLIEQHQPLAYGKPYEVIVRLGETRRVPIGLEFDVVTEFLDGADIAWSAVTTILHRIPGPKGPGKREQKVPLAASECEYIGLSVPEGQGRAYAKVSNDYNPIHLYANTAKLFGFKQAIAHGMWSAAKALALVEPKLGKPATRYEVSFKQPVFLPSKTTLKVQAVEGLGRFELLAARDSKVLLEGDISA